ncbi:unnamed protein product [Haemonchus placei]|uniref:Secreted protein n=1 Tax=Haemonchus placei TaxID=6290 RepID=A0A0N4X3M5_HAEPC|nr:unnamed protein product [Haemonchus placei]
MKALPHWPNLGMVVGLASTFHTVRYRKTKHRSSCRTCRLAMTRVPSNGLASNVYRLVCNIRDSRYHEPCQSHQFSQCYSHAPCNFWLQDRDDKTELIPNTPFHQRFGRPIHSTRLLSVQADYPHSLQHQGAENVNSREDYPFPSFPLRLILADHPTQHHTA